MSFQPERTKLLGVDDEQTRSLTYDDDEAARQAEEARNFERAARARALGSVPLSDAPADLPPPPHKPDNDRFLGSVGLLVLRLILVAFVGVRGIQVLFDIEGTTAWLAGHGLPAITVLAWVLGVVLLLCTLMLLLGFGTRTAALIIALMTIALLVFVRWGAVPMFSAGQPGFLGEGELLAAGVALALVFLGSGGWAVDGAMRHSRWQDAH